MHDSVGLIAYKGETLNNLKHGEGVEYNDIVGNICTSVDYTDFDKVGNNWVKY